MQIPHFPIISCSKQVQIVLIEPAEGTSKGLSTGFVSIKSRLKRSTNGHIVQVWMSPPVRITLADKCHENMIRLVPCCSAGEELARYSIFPWCFLSMATSMAESLLTKRSEGELTDRFEFRLAFCQQVIEYRWKTRRASAAVSLIRSLHFVVLVRCEIRSLTYVDQC